MKNTFFSVIVVLVLLLTMVGCSKDQLIVTKKQPSIEEFQKSNNFWSENQVFDSDGKLLLDEIGENPENALVILIFDENKSLYSPENFDEEQEVENVYYTDIATFEKITKQSGLNEYADVLPMKDGESVFLYDPFSVNSLTRKEKLELFEKIKVSVTPRATEIATSRSYWNSYPPNNLPTSYLWLGDAVIGYHPTNNPTSWFGHTGIVTKLQNNGYTNGNPYHSGTKTTEAIASGIPVKTRKFKTYWTNSNFDWHALIAPMGATEEQMDEASYFAQAQEGEPYAISSKFTYNSWYCSKLVWRTYKNEFNLNLDYDRGALVYPIDLLLGAYYSNNALIYNFYVD